MARKPDPRPDFDEITIVVPGLIQPWKRVQYNRKNDNWYTDQKVEAYQSGVRHEANLIMAGSPPIQCEYPLELSFLAVWPIPKSWSKRRREQTIQRGGALKVTRPDIDNTIKGIMDALKMIVYEDDAQIAVLGRCAKIYAERPRLEIRFTILDESEVPTALPEQPVAAQLELFTPH